MGIKSEQKNDDVVIRINGHFGFGQYREFRDAYRNSVEAHPHYTIDMHDTLSMDSAAVGMLLVLREQAGGDVTIANPSVPVLRFMHLAGIDDRFQIR